MNVRISMLKDIEKLSLKSKVLSNCVLIYSCWLGYIEQDEQYKQFLERISELGIDIKYLHTSGHADSYTFKEILSITNPKIAAIPIHTEYGERLKEYTDKAVILRDNEILDINERGDFKIMRNDIEYEPITYEEVMKRLEGKKLEDYTKGDTLDRYVAYSTEEEMQMPEVQQLLIKHKLYEELLHSIDIITNKAVIQDLLSSDLFQDKNNTIIEGKILEIQKEPFAVLDKKYIVHNIIVTFEEINTSIKHKLKAYVILEEKELKHYKQTMRPYYNNVVAIINHRENDEYIMCYLQKYEDIDYTKYKKSAT